MFFQSRMQLKIAVGLILLNLPLGWLICSNLGTVVEFQGGWFAKYSVLSIKRTVLLKVLLPKNARCVNTFPFSGNKSKTFEFKNISTYCVPYIRFCVLFLLSLLFSIFQKISIKNTVRLIESTE